MNKKLNCILLVDDDNVTNFLHKKILKAADITENILIALNGEEALDIIRNTSMNSNPQPELIILDINMPRMNGWEFIEEYQKLDESMKGKLIIVMLTSSLNPDDAIKANNSPAIIGFSTKPLNVVEIQKIIQKHFDHQ